MPPLETFLAEAERLRDGAAVPRFVELIEAMTRHIERWAPPGADITIWRYK